MEKEVSTIMKGYFYPSMQTSRCPLYHRCLLTGKCQNYDPHNLKCAVCETRVSPPGKLGGVLPEGKYMPDLQDAVRTIENLLQAPLADRNQKGQSMESIAEITDKQTKLKKSTEMCQMFLNSGVWDMEHKVMDALYDVEKKKFLGRL